MVRIVACCILAVGVASLYACKDQDPHPPAADINGQSNPTENVTGSSGNTDENDDGGSTTVSDGGALTLTDGAVVACTALNMGGNLVDEEAENGTIPAGSGGTLANGAYNLTQVTKYINATGSTGLGPTGVTYASSIQITNGVTFERVVDIGSNATGAGSEERYLGILSAVSPTMTITFSCPLQSTEQYTYSATETQLVLNNTSTGESYTYVKQL